jgi:hypothetical protein
MPTVVLTNAVVTVGGQDLSSLANSITLTYEIDSVEATGFGQQHNFIGGLQNNSVEVTLMQDFATTKTEPVIYPLVGTQTTVTVKATTGATSTTNPLYTLSSTFLASHTPVAGAVGELAMSSLTFTGGTLVKTTA